MSQTTTTKNDDNVLDEIDSITQEFDKLKIKNKGTGAGGSNTNKNGLPYEDLTELREDENFTTKEKSKFSSIVIFNNFDKPFIKTKQRNFFKCMDEYLDKTVEKGHGCKNPDECYIDLKTKIIFIIEKKFQQSSGSVCEKIQTPPFKKWIYGRMFPKFNIVYILCF